MSRGLEMLQERVLTKQEVARRLHISRSTLSVILSGSRKPGKRLALLMEKEFGIPADAWHTLPNGNGQPK